MHVRNLTIAVACWLLAAPLVRAQQPVALELGKPVKAELAGGQTHRYTVTAQKGQYFRVNAQGLGFPAVVRIFAPDRVASQIEMAWQAAPTATNTIVWVAKASGEHRIEIAASNSNAAPASYEVMLAKLREALPADLKLVETQSLNQIPVGGPKVSTRSIPHWIRRYPMIGITVFIIGQSILYAIRRRRMGALLWSSTPTSTFAGTGLAIFFALMAVVHWADSFAYDAGDSQLRLWDAADGTMCFVLGAYSVVSRKMHLFENGIGICGGIYTWDRLDGWGIKESDFNLYRKSWMGSRWNTRVKSTPELEVLLNKYLPGKQRDG